MHGTGRIQTQTGLHSDSGARSRRGDRPGKKLGYLIQKHDATRLHYDFRLELDGVLLSWAVTKGPSLNPADKRLAVRTEDHPLSYGIVRRAPSPKGEYGGGTVMLWDKGTWEPKADPHAGLKKGHLTFTLHGERLKGGWDLIRMRGADEKRENWLLIKEDDAEANRNGATVRFFENLASSVKTGRSMDEIRGEARSKETSAIRRRRQKKLRRLMRALSGGAARDTCRRRARGDDWVHEIKFDGYRLLGFVAGGDVASAHAQRQ